MGNQTTLAHRYVDDLQYSDAEFTPLPKVQIDTGAKGYFYGEKRDVIVGTHVGLSHIILEVEGVYQKALDSYIGTYAYGVELKKDSLSAYIPYTRKRKERDRYSPPISEPKEIHRRTYTVTVKEVGEPRCVCVVDFDGVPLEVTFPSSVIKTHNLKEKDKFEFTKSDGYEIKPEDCKPLKKSKPWTEEQKKRFIAFLHKTISIHKSRQDQF